MAIDNFDEAADYIRYGLDYAAYLVCREDPTTVHIASRQSPVVESLLRRLPRHVATSVADAEVAGLVAARSGRTILAGTGEGAEAVIVPFASEEWGSVPQARLTVVVEENACSYKSILMPGRLRVTAGQTLSWLARRSTVTERVGLLGPDFIALWALVRLVGHRRSDWHFRLRDAAMQRIFRRDLLWRYSYVVVLAGRAE